MQADLLKRLENTLGDCVIGPIRTLKTGDLADVLYDAHKEIERLRAENERLREAMLATLSTTVHLCNALDVDMEETFIRVKNSKSGDVLAKRSVADIVQAGCDILGEEKKACPTNTTK